MHLVVDANVLFSALLKDGLTRKLIYDDRLSLYSPEYLLVELRKYYQELQSKSGLGEEEFKKSLARILSKITLVPDNDLAIYLAPARTLIQDEKDLLYLACALSIGADLWSHDPHLKQKRVKCWSTKEVGVELGFLQKT